jgi:hypothetical protein
MDVLNVAVRNYEALGRSLKDCPLKEADDIIDSMEQEILVFRHLHPEVAATMQYHRDVVETRKRLKQTVANPASV